MARRGLMTALQAALAGAGGVAQGLVAAEERKRKRFLEDEAKKRQDLMDTISLMERGAFEAGPIATRAPVAPAKMTPTTQLPPTAIPLPTQIAPEAMQQAQAQQARYETGGPGAMSVTVGGRNLVLPSAATMRGEQAQTALDQAIRQARAQAGVSRESAVQSQKDSYDTLKALGAPEGKREFKEGIRYDTILNDFMDRRKIAATRAASAGRTPETMAAFIDKQVADEVARRVAAGKPLSPTEAAQGKKPEPYTAKEIQALATELRQGLNAAFAPPPRDYDADFAKLADTFNQELGRATTDAQRAQARARYERAVTAVARQQDAGRQVTYQDIWGRGGAAQTDSILDLSPAAAERAGALDTGKAPAAAPKDSVTAPPATDTTRTTRNLVPGATAPLDTAAVRYGEEVGMPESAIRRPAPAPRYRPVQENPMSPEGINEIPMPAMADSLQSPTRQPSVTDLLRMRDELTSALEQIRQGNQTQSSRITLDITNNLYQVNQQLQRAGVPTNTLPSGRYF